MTLKILYRGHLSDCNYSCYYCPFGKHVNSEEELVKDREDLQRFVTWVKETSSESLSIELLFTPFGEALVREWYREAIIELSNMDCVSKVAVQTNLSCDLEWLTDCGDSLALWTTFHPTMVSVSEFKNKCEWLKEHSIRHSVGSVGIKEDFQTIKMLLELVHDETYHWVNAYKHEPNYYSPEDISFITEIDPYFEQNLGEYSTLGKTCRTGASVVSIEGNGDLYRCNFIKEKRGNIFTDSIEDLLFDSPCTNESCHCHIGYIHLEDSPFTDLYGDGILERIPQNWSSRDK